MMIVSLLVSLIALHDDAATNFRIAEAKEIIQEIAQKAHLDVRISNEVAGRIIGLRWSSENPDAAIRAVAKCVGAEIETREARITLRGRSQANSATWIQFRKSIESGTQIGAADQILPLIARSLNLHNVLPSPSQIGRTTRIWLDEETNSAQIDWRDVRTKLTHAWDYQKLSGEQKTRSVSLLRKPIGVLVSVSLTPSAYELGCLICTTDFDFLKFDSAHISISEPKSEVPLGPKVETTQSPLLSSWFSVKDFQPSWQEGGASVAARRDMQSLTPIADAIPGQPLYDDLMRTACEIAGTAKIVAFAFPDLIIGWASRGGAKLDLWKVLSGRTGLLSMECLESADTFVVRPRIARTGEMLVEPTVMRHVCTQWAKGQIDIRNTCLMYEQSTREPEIESIQSRYVSQASFSRGGLWPIPGNYAQCLAFLGSLSPSQFDAISEQGLGASSLSANQRERLLDAILSSAPWNSSSNDEHPIWGDVIQKRSGLMLHVAQSESLILGNPDRDPVSNSVDWSRFTPEQLGTQLGYLAKSQAWATLTPLKEARYRTASVPGLRLSIGSAESVRSWVDIPLNIPKWSQDATELGKLDKITLNRIIGAFKRTAGDIPEGSEIVPRGSPE